MLIDRSDSDDSDSKRLHDAKKDSEDSDSDQVTFLIRFVYTVIACFSSCSSIEMKCFL